MGYEKVLDDNWQVDQINYIIQVVDVNNGCILVLLKLYDFYTNKCCKFSKFLL